VWFFNNKLLKDPSEKMAKFCEIFMHSIIEDCYVNGIFGIKRCIRQKDDCAQTDGSNMLEITKHENVDPLSVSTNNVMEVYTHLGVESAGLIMQEEFQRVLAFDGSYVDEKHTWLLVDTMTHSGNINPLNRFKMEEMGGSILQRASFEQTLEVFESGAAFGKQDFLSGSTERMVVGQPVRVGTGCFSVLSTLPSGIQDLQDQDLQDLQDQDVLDELDQQDLDQQDLLDQQVQRNQDQRNQHQRNQHQRNQQEQEERKQHKKQNEKEYKQLIQSSSLKEKQRKKSKSEIELKLKDENKILSLMSFSKKEKIVVPNECFIPLITFFKEICILASQKKNARIVLYVKDGIEKEEFLNLQEKWNDKNISNSVYLKVNYKNSNKSEIKSKIFQKENEKESSRKDYREIIYRASDDMFHKEKKKKIFIKLENWENVNQGDQDDSVVAEKTTLIFENVYNPPNTPDFKIIFQQKWKGENFQSLENQYQNQNNSAHYRIKIEFSCPWKIQSKFTVEKISELFVECYFSFLNVNKK
jgi:hypothetical protein